MAFKTMEWIRKVRDEQYKQCKNMTAVEKIEHTKVMAKKLSKKKCEAIFKKQRPFKQM